MQDDVPWKNSVFSRVPSNYLSVGFFLARYPPNGKKKQISSEER